MKTSRTTDRPPVIAEEACRGFQTAIEVVGRRWTAAVLRALALGAERFGDIRWRVHGISDRLLALRLKELEAEGLITRTVVPTTPVQVRYGLTKRGHDLTVALQPLVDWSIAVNGHG
jgi:DNA-binding HxlR family transcriptional regulator